MKIPWQSLSESALKGLVQEFVSREGTDYGDHEVDFEKKVQQVMAQIRTGTVEIVFDNESQTTSILPLAP